MATFETSKILAGIGSLLYIVPIVGLILVLIGMKDLSEHYKDRRIYDGLVMSIVLLMIASIMFAGGAAIFYSTIFSMFLGLALVTIIGGLVCFIIGFILALLAVQRVRICLNALAERSGQNLFRTAGTLIWIGAILMIVGIGGVIIWIGFIVAAIGFFTAKDNQPQQAYGYAPPPTNIQSPSPSQTSDSSKANFCANCGTSVTPEATFCANCGKQI
jgi:uncharacterized membrane protein